MSEVVEGPVARVGAPEPPRSGETDRHAKVVLLETLPPAHTLWTPSQALQQNSMSSCVETG